MRDREPETVERKRDGRVFGLTPKARRVVRWTLVIAVIAIPLSYGIGRASGRTPIGGDLALLVPSPTSKNVLVGGEWGAAGGGSTSAWRPIVGLNGKDVMAWATTGSRLLAGAHQGLYVSDDNGATFASNHGVPADDVHAVGAAGQTVYVGAPDGALWVSTDGGNVFSQVGQPKASFMGSIWVDPANPAIAIAPSMDYGAMRTTDQGHDWQRLGGPRDALSVTVDPIGSRIVVVGRHGAQVTTDGGRTWVTLPVPRGTMTANFDGRGSLLVARWRGDRVDVMRQTGNSWISLGTTAVR